jgi:hypothetical protein
MFTAIITVLIVLWIAGMVTSYTMGGYIHALLVAAVVMLLLRMFWDRRPQSK